MRRYVALLLILGAFVVLAVWLRPRRMMDPRVAAAAPQVESTIEGSEVEPDAAPVHAPPPSPVPGSTHSRPGTGRGVPAPGRECAILVVDVSGATVPHAAVYILTHSYGTPSAHTKVADQRTNDAGQATLRMGMHDTADIFAYKVGVGTGASAPVRAQTDVTIKLKASPNLDLWCLGMHDVPLEGAEVALATEVLYFGRRDAYGSRTVISIPLPMRKVMTKLDGSGQIETIFEPVELKEAEWRPPTPGLRLHLTAEWNRMTAQLMLDKPIDGPVSIYPQ